MSVMSESKPNATLAPPLTEGSSDAALAVIVERMADELRELGSVDLEAWQAKYPELASEISRLAPTLQALVDLSTDGAQPPAVEPQESFGGKTLGDFRIVREIGRGGMGIVYEAEQLSLS